MSPEVFVRAGYDTSADIWSLACTIFEIATGCLLFKPKKHEKWSKDEDHLKQYTEFIGSGFLINLIKNFSFRLTVTRLGSSDCNL